MNAGAFIFEHGLLSREEVAEATALAMKLYETKRPVHADGQYSDLRWFQVDLDPHWPIAQKIISALGAEKPELLVFYYLEPGTKLHPHRDLTGASLNNRVRFHVPVITNPKVDFRVSKERVFMEPGDLWCLDTSYLHSVENGGDETRVHIIVEAYISPQMRARMPSGIKAFAHNAFYAAVLGFAMLKALTVNSLKNPKYFLAQMGMVRDYIGWRFLKTRRPK